MKTSELDYDLPTELIAQHPYEQRDASRLLVLNRADGGITFDVFRNIAGYLAPGDCVVTNDTKVIRARLRAIKPTGARVEIFLLHEETPGVWVALVRPSARVKPGARVRIAGEIEAEVADVLSEGRRRVVFETPDVLGLLERLGEIPLPPYIERKTPDEADLTRYQTVYARVPGAVAAPTAGLHYTPDVFQSLSRAGVLNAAITLHVGYGTFRPILADTLEEHAVEPEEFIVPEETAALLNRVRAHGGRVAAVGTTVARVLEFQFRDGAYRPGVGKTDLYVHPPYAFRAVDVLQTNFHLPRSSLLALVCAFAGRDSVLEAYSLAIKERFRFYSYGDTMLIL
jgi:S-adenosylmethionine:tRNA ribosyltransferase-isomerase